MLLFRAAATVKILSVVFLAFYLAEYTALNTSLLRCSSAAILETPGNEIRHQTMLFAQSIILSMSHHCSADALFSSCD